jgi:hypothetical protein
MGGGGGDIGGGDIGGGDGDGGDQINPNATWDDPYTADDRRQGIREQDQMDYIQDLQERFHSDPGNQFYDPDFTSPLADMTLEEYQASQSQGQLEEMQAAATQPSTTQVLQGQQEPQFQYAGATGGADATTDYAEDTHVLQGAQTAATPPSTSTGLSLSPAPDSRAMPVDQVFQDWYESGDNPTPLSDLSYDDTWNTYFSYLFQNKDV